MRACASSAERAYKRMSVRRTASRASCRATPVSAHVAGGGVAFSSHSTYVPMCARSASQSTTQSAHTARLCTKQYCTGVSKSVAGEGGECATYQVCALPALADAHQKDAGDTRCLTGLLRGAARLGGGGREGCDVDASRTTPGAQPKILRPTPTHSQHSDPGRAVHGALAAHQRGARRRTVRREDAMLNSPLHSPTGSFPCPLRFISRTPISPHNLYFCASWRFMSRQRRLALSPNASSKTLLLPSPFMLLARRFSRRLALKWMPCTRDRCLNQRCT